MSNFCDTLNCSPPGFSVHGISQARVLGWVAISFSRGSSQPRDRTQVSCIFLPLRQQGCPSISSEELLKNKAKNKAIKLTRIKIEYKSIGKFSFLHTVLAFIVCRLFDDGLSDWCEVIPNCIFCFSFKKMYLFLFLIVLHTGFL